MRPPSAFEHLRRSAKALDEGNLEQAQAEAEKAMAINNGLADAFTIHGIALARMGKKDSATLSFRKALMLEPHRPRHAYNLGAHLFAHREFKSARKAVRESLKDDPDFAPAKALLDRIDAQEYEGTIIFVTPQIKSLQQEEVDDRQPHLIPFMAGMEKQWTWVGWTFAFIALIAAICVIVFHPIPSEAKQPLAQGTGPVLTVFLMAMSGICSLMWLLIDLVDRQMKLVWIVPGIACCACGFHVIPHTLYMLMRKAE